MADIDNNKDVTFIFHKDWVSSISHLSIEEQDKAIADMVRFGCDMELKYQDINNENNKNIITAINFVKPKITDSKIKYQKKVEDGKKNGSNNKKFADKVVYELAQQYTKSQEIADILNCSKSTIDHSNGWRYRKENNLNFGEDGMIII